MRNREGTLRMVLCKLLRLLLRRVQRGLNVRINAAGLKDRAAADALVAEADRLAAEAERAEREVLEIVASKI